MSRVEFGRWLREARWRADMTQRDVAARLGIDHTYVSKIEAGAALGGIAETTLRGLADAYGLDGDETVLRAGKLPEAFVADLLALPPELALGVWAFFRGAAQR